MLTVDGGHMMTGEKSDNGEIRTHEEKHGAMITNLFSFETIYTDILTIYTCIKKS